MATYSYKCSACGNVFDLNASLQEKEEGKSEKFVCPKCKSKKIKQEFSAINFVKNVFKKEAAAGSCCADGNACGPQCAPDKADNGASDAGANGSCCG